MIPSRRTLLAAAARRLARELSQARPQLAELRMLPRAAPRRSDRLVGAVAHAGLYLALLAAVGAFFSPVLGSGTWQGEARIAIGAVLAGEGLLLFTNWRGARRLLLARLHARSRPPASFLEAARRRLLGPALALVALLAFAGGLILVGQGVGDLV